MGRLKRYAVLSLLQALALVLALVSGSVIALIGFVVLTLSLVWSWGQYQADLAFNEGLDEPERSRWRLAFWFVPGAMALYWLLHVRPRLIVD